MFSIKIKYFLYGMITSVSLISIVTYANIDHPDGVFGGYFERMTGLCTSNSTITGFKDDSEHFGEQECTTINTLVESLDIYHLLGNIGIGNPIPTSKLDVNGKIQSHETEITDSGTVVTTKSYVDNGLKSLCTSMGGTWSELLKICTPTYTYSWQIGTYGACSLSCGPGTQTATVNCMRSDGNIELDSKCAGTKPTASQSCNLGVCLTPPVITLYRGNTNLSSGQNQPLTVSTTNATSLNWSCIGAGAHSDGAPLSFSTNYSWAELQAGGWNGFYSCTWVAVGPGGTTTHNESFTIQPLVPAVPAPVAPAPVLPVVPVFPSPVAPAPFIPAPVSCEWNHKEEWAPGIWVDIYVCACPSGSFTTTNPSPTCP